jgi:hypothetical protein
MFIEVGGLADRGVRDVGENVVLLIYPVGSKVWC